jgi:hypothetical protein
VLDEGFHKQDSLSPELPAYNSRTRWRQGRRRHLAVDEGCHLSHALDGQNLLSATLGASTRQERAGLPSRRTAHAPHPNSQPLCAVCPRSAKYLEQSLVGREGDVGFLAVQRETEMRRFLRFDRLSGHVQSPHKSIRWPMCVFVFVLRNTTVRCATRFSFNGMSRQSIGFCQQTADEKIGELLSYFG